eukprot:m.30306 g.30306  ORF g.30306 m.30306 type:complete len:844 (-) comp6222_c0_seq1:228-2759(-)
MDDDELYSGYDDYDDALDVDVLDENNDFQEALKTAYGKRAGLKTAAMARGKTGTTGGRGTTGMRLTTGFAASMDGGQKRLMTAVTAAKFTVNQDAVPQQSIGTKPLEHPNDSTPEAEVKRMEEKVHRLIEESAMHIQKEEFQKALETAKEAVLHERQLNKKKEAIMTQDTPNVDLTFSVLTHLACVQEQCEMFPEAIQTLTSLVRSKPFDRAGRLRVNIGNIYFKQKKYLQAVKQYQMALDQISTEQQELRNNVLRNIGQAFIAMGQYGDAMKTLEHVLEETPIRELDGEETRDAGTDFVSAFNSMLCYFALGDREKMRRGFVQLLTLQLPSAEDDDRYLNISNDEQLQLFLDAVADDNLRQFEIKTKKQADGFVLTAAKLISPVIDNSFAEGYDWCIERVKSSSFVYLAAELEITKAIAYLKMKNIKAATKILKGFEKRETNMLSTAATNLSFLYILENDVQQAERYVDIAMEADKYNPNAIVNKGTCMFLNKKFEEAQEFYQEALSIDGSNVEALYNLGLVHKDLGNMEDALEYFYHVNVLVPDTPEIVAQIANLHEAMGDPEQAVEWLNSLISLVPSDPNALAHLGDIFDQDDKSQAFQYHFESFRYFPSDITTIAWFSSYHVESQAFEKAIQFLEKAVEIQPGEVKWRMRIAACWKRTGNYQRALDAYKEIHTLFPDHIECLTILVRICTDMGLSEADTYAQALKRAEQSKERKERAMSGKRKGSARRSAKLTRHSSGRRNQSGRNRSGRDSATSGRDSAETGRETSAQSTERFSPMQSTKSPEFEPSAHIKAPQAMALDASYKDPIGSLPIRPKTSMKGQQDEDDEWADIDDDVMLPE